MHVHSHNNVKSHEPVSTNNVEMHGINHSTGTSTPEEIASSAFYLGYFDNIVEAYKRGPIPGMNPALYMGELKTYMLNAINRYKNYADQSGDAKLMADYNRIGAALQGLSRSSPAADWDKAVATLSSSEMTNREDAFNFLQSSLCTFSFSETTSPDTALLYIQFLSSLYDNPSDPNYAKYEAYGNQWFGRGNQVKAYTLLGGLCTSYFAKPPYPSLCYNLKVFHAIMCQNVALESPYAEFLRTLPKPPPVQNPSQIVRDLVDFNLLPHFGRPQADDVQDAHVTAAMLTSLANLETDETNDMSTIQLIDETQFVRI